MPNKKQNESAHKSFLSAILRTPGKPHEIAIRRSSFGSLAVEKITCPLLRGTSPMGGGGGGSKIGNF